MSPDLDDAPPEHLGGHGLAPGSLGLAPHDPLFIFVYFLYLFLVYFLYLGKQNRATNPVSQEHLGQGLLVGQQGRKSISGNLRRMLTSS